MIRTSLGALAALAIAAMVGALALLAQPGAVEAQSHSATRTFQQDWASPGGEFTVTITANNYGPIGPGGGDAAGRLHLRKLDAAGQSD